VADEPVRPDPLIVPIDPAVEAVASEFLRSGGGFLKQADRAPVSTAPVEATGETSPPESAGSVGFLT
jgi:hypothetical protein